ncbi:putative nuclease HARBI1 [Bombyx mori]|uniref:DDE Tnp4 domain-containing protein n=1 Tax=Bombyx mori TaxID=7091 RepID=A0A8R2R4E9_BOMMO|nr:putative nuclease HARBI1 [Bombyx mori]
MASCSSDDSDIELFEMMLDFDADSDIVHVSINVQVVCNALLIFQNVVARWPGSTHDATIFNHSDLKDHCEHGGLGNRWLLGDSGYPCKPYLLTPLINPRTQSEQLYNESHIKTRNTIERCIGVWKRRFPVLSLKGRLKLENMQAVIIATAVLHNIARNMNLEDLEPEISVPDMIHENNIIVHNNFPERTSGRQLLINNYFQI